MINNPPPQSLKPIPTPRLRGEAGKKQRARRLKLYPLCAHCKAQGFITATKWIDHIIRLIDGGPDSDSNTQGLCDDCHKKKTRGEASGKHGFDKNGKPLDPKHPWNTAK